MTQPDQSGCASRATNYMLPVFGQTAYDVQFRMWFLDTGDSDCEDIKGYACILPD